MIEKVFAPFGDFQPDQGWFRNDGLVAMSGLIPAHGDYLVSPVVQAVTSQIGGAGSTYAYGAHLHSGGGLNYGYAGTAAKLWELGTSMTDVTRGAGPYTTPDEVSGWQGVSFGDSVIMTNYVDDPQIQLTRGAQFQKLASSTFAPRARFPFVIRGNLFLANCNLPASFDGLSSGANPTLVVWSQTDAPRSFGSFRATPELVGADYQPIGNDYGEILGAIGGDFGIVFQARGATRIDGPPYQFRDLPGVYCRFPNSIFRVGNDIYYWSPSGPAVLRDGQGQPELLGLGRVSRSITSQPGESLSDAFEMFLTEDPIYVSGSFDPNLGLAIWTYSSVTGHGAAGTDTLRGDAALVYDTRNDRFGFFNAPENSGFLFLKTQGVGGATSLLSQQFVQDRLVTGNRQDRFAQWVQPGAAGAVTTTHSLTRAYLQLQENEVTFVRRVRPIINFDAPTTDVSIAVSIRSRNQLFSTAGDQTAGPFTTLDTEGFVVTPGAPAAAFHAITVTVTIDSTLAPRGYVPWEFEGMEIEYGTKGDRSA